MVGPGQRSVATAAVSAPVTRRCRDRRAVVTALAAWWRPGAGDAGCGGHTLRPARPQKSAVSCKAYSPSIDRHILVVFKTAAGGNKVIQFLDGIDGAMAERGQSTTSTMTTPPRLPCGRPPLLQSTVQPAPGGKEMKYETFMIQGRPPSKGSGGTAADRTGIVD